jgi:hypothetical protein
MVGKDIIIKGTKKTKIPLTACLKEFVYKYINNVWNKKFKIIYW